MTKSAGNYRFGHSYWKKILNGKLHFLCSVGLTHLWIILFNGTFISFIVEKFLYSLKLFGTAVLFFFNYQFPFFHFSFSSFSLIFICLPFFYFKMSLLMFHISLFVTKENSFLRIWSPLLKKSWMDNFILCAMSD